MLNKQVLSRTATKRNLLFSQSVLESSQKSSLQQKSSRHMKVKSQVLCNTPSGQEKYKTDMFKEQSLFSEDSDNDLFRESSQKPPKTASSIKPRSKILNQMAYLTQKMTPDYQRRMQLISQAEDKVLDFRIEQTEQPIQVNSQQLSFGETLINYQHDKHPIELQPELWNVQSVRQMEFYYYKIRSKMQPVPLQFYMNQIESTNFKIFVSSVNPFPTNFSCDQIISVKGWKYKVDESKIFHCDYIYISMVCDLDTQVKLKYQFGSRMMKRPQTMQKKMETESMFLQNPQQQQLERMNSDFLLAQVAEIKKRRKQRLRQRGIFKDLIKENIQKVVEYNEEQQKSFRELKRVQSDNRIEDVLIRKKQLNQNEQSRKVYEQKTRELGKILRQRSNFVQSKKTLKNKVCHHWLNFIYMALISSRILHVYQHKIEAQNQSTLMAFQVKRIMKRIHKRLIAIKGLTLYDRVFFDVKLASQCFCRAVYQKQVQEHIQKIVPFLKQRAELHHFKNQVVSTHLKIQKIRQLVQEFLLRFKNYKKLLGGVWQKYFKEQLLKNYNQLSQKKKEMYQQYIFLLQNQENYNILLTEFMNSYSKAVLRTFLKEMSVYSQYLKKLRSQKYNKTKRRDLEQNEQVMYQPKMFQIPSYDDILEYLPILMSSNNRQDARSSQQISQSQILSIGENNEKKRKQIRMRK
ncbi:unnamed protein product (macronuclear) [Paramecium tetraurelia]|uniref:SUN domain-containing protein n=1 Tax=Paramecium tetraurelia TaxID=5888 RepID=A0DKA9_PARTE|nr:uncharacterized protein GSPATT00017805001 [Paramecium tetraurelia]CAK83476.1 unnamed protein product [Paramecium tetraurelia]|eukprot:XP_001450873.1 hypothetical protein (macronuclear) [Paramecium tetraurelia strain d4-2]